MLKNIKTFFLGVFLISPIVLLLLYTINTARKEAAKTNVNVSNLKLVTPVAIIDEITKKIEEGDLEDAITKINTDLPDPNIPSSNGTPLLVLVAEKDYTDLVAALLQKGANPDIADLNTSETALIKAVRNQNFDTISILLNAGANPNLGTNQGLTPLGLAINLRNENLATHLLSSGATNGISKDNLFLYAFKKNPVGVGLMLAGGVTPSVTDKDDNTPLIVSAANGDLESIKLLISYRASVNVKNKHGMTPLLYALKGKHWDVAEYLITNGAKINASNIYGQNALFWAAYHGNANMVHDLLMRGADYQKKTRLGQTALQMARALGHKEAAKMLEDFIAYKNLPRDEKGNIILPKVNQQTATSSVPVYAFTQDAETGNLNNDIASDIKNQAQQNQVIVQQNPAIVQQTQENQSTQQEQQNQTAVDQPDTRTQVPTQQVQNKTQQNQLPSSNSQATTQPIKTQVNSMQNKATQAETPQMPQMPDGMDMSAIMSMMGGGQGSQGGDMGDMLKQLQNMGAASQGGSKTQQMPNMPSNVQMPAGMDMGDISKMIPAGMLPEGMNLNDLTSMNPEQLKQMGIPEDQIGNITKAQQQMGQVQNTVSNITGMQPKDLNNMSNTTYQNGVMKTQINKLKSSGN